MNSPALLRHALRCLDTLEPLGGPPRWTLGGGAALALAWAHRTTLDVDVFLRDAQWLTALSPRLNSQTGRGAADYEEGSSSLRISFPDGAVDFVIAPQLTTMEAVPTELEHREILVDSPIEVLAKKIHYRAVEFRVRDVVDLAVALAHRTDGLELLRPFADAKRGALERRLDALEPSFERRALSELHLSDQAQTLIPGAIGAVRAWLLAGLP
jgi:hypothetical protein